MADMVIGGNVGVAARPAAGNREEKAPLLVRMLLDAIVSGVERSDARFRSRDRRPYIGLESRGGGACGGQFIAW
jgi:hypothetical protein